MTSQPSLPIVYHGMIWDGVTEYQDVPPDGVSRVRLLRMYSDGSRRYSETAHHSHPMIGIRLAASRGWEIIGIGIYLDRHHQHDEGYLGYGGELSLEPVNQIPWLQTYQRNAAISAHDLQVTLGTDVMQSATADDYNTVKNTFFHLIGAAWQRYVEWAKVDPEELIIGGNNDGLTLWEHGVDGLAYHAATDEALCGTCDIANFARRFYFHANLPLFRRLHRSGIIYSVDRSVTPWEAQIFAVASQPQSQYYDDLDTAYHEALRYYDENVGARLHQV